MMARLDENRALLTDKHNTIVRLLDDNKTLRALLDGRDGGAVKRDAVA